MPEEQEARWGGDELDTEDLQIPEIKLIQATGGSLAKGEGAEPGDFHASLTGDVYKGKEGFDMVVVRMAKQRTYWGRTEMTDEPPKCASLQVTPQGGQSIFGDDCSECEHRLDAPGAVSAEERRNGCTIGYNILSLIEEIPMILRPSGISAGAAKELYTQLTLNRQIAKQWYRAKTHVTSVSKTTQSGEAFALRFGKLELITDEAQLEINASQAAQLLGAQIAELPSPIEENAAPVQAQIVESTATEKTAAASEPAAAEKTTTLPSYEETNAKIAAAEKTTKQAPSALKTEPAPEVKPEPKQEAAEIDMDF